MDLGSSKDNFTNNKAQSVDIATRSSIKSDNLLPRRDIYGAIFPTSSSIRWWHFSFPCKEFYRINRSSSLDLDFWDLIVIFDCKTKLISSCSTLSLSEISVNTIGHFELNPVNITSRSSHNSYYSPSRFSYFVLETASSITTIRSWSADLKFSRIR